MTRLKKEGRPGWNQDDPQHNSDLDNTNIQEPEDKSRAHFEIEAHKRIKQIGALVRENNADGRLDNKSNVLHLICNAYSASQRGFLEYHVRNKVKYLGLSFSEELCKEAFKGRCLGKKERLISNNTAGKTMNVTYEQKRRLKLDTFNAINVKNDDHLEIKKLENSYERRAATPPERRKKPLDLISSTECALLRAMHANPDATQRAWAASIGKGVATVGRTLVKLHARGYVENMDDAWTATNAGLSMIFGNPDKAKRVRENLSKSEPWKDEGFCRKTFERRVNRARTAKKDVAKAEQTTAKGTKPCSAFATDPLHEKVSTINKIGVKRDPVIVSDTKTPKVVAVDEARFASRPLLKDWAPHEIDSRHIDDAPPVYDESLEKEAEFYVRYEPEYLP